MQQVDGEKQVVEIRKCEERKSVFIKINVQTIEFFKQIEHIKMYQRND